MDRNKDNLNKLASFLDGTRDQLDFDSLSDWIVEDDSHVSQFVAQLQIEEDLRRLSLHDDISRYSETSEKVNTQEQRARAENTNYSWFAKSTFHYALAGSLLLALVAMLTIKQPLIQLSQVASVDSSPEAQPGIVATLCGVDNCKWLSQTYSSGQHFTAGSNITLEKGVAQLTFETGAVLVMQAPCDLELKDNAIELTHGRISAVVPTSASGFAVSTPSSEVIDIGTEFGVSVDDSDGTEVHVFSGEVVTRARDEDGKAVGEPIFLTTNNAIHFRTGTDEAERFIANEKAFVRWIDNQSDIHVDKQPPIEGDLVLWLDSNHWILDGNGLVNAWRDSLTASNQIPDNALQADPDARPTVVQRAIGDWPALRFDGQNDCLITTPITTGDNQTISFVASVHQGNHHDAQIINYNGPPQLESWDRNDQNILQFVTRINEDDKVCFHPFAFLGFVGDQGIRVGEADHPEYSPSQFDNPSVGEPFVIVYVYCKDNNQASLWVNGKLAGTSSAPAAIALRSRKVIGRHGGWPSHYCGDIAEIMIFNEGLDEDRVISLSQKLCKKYDIALAD